MLVANRRDFLTIEVAIGRDFRRPAVLKGRVSRIGSHPSCELRLSDAYAPPHLVTIEQKDGEVYLHNTSGHVIQVGDELLEADASRLWFPAEPAKLNTWVTIELARDKTGSAHTRGKASKKASGGLESVVDPLAKPKTTSRDAASFALSAVMLVVLAWLVLEPSDSGTSAATTSVAALIQAAHGAEPGVGVQDPIKVDLCLQIQAGRSAQLRGDNKRARKIYEGVRDALLADRPADGRFEDSWDEQAFQLVRNGLNSL